MRASALDTWPHILTLKKEMAVANKFIPPLITAQDGGCSEMPFEKKSFNRLTYLP